MVRVDNTGFGDIKIIQDSGGFCYGVDAVILTDFIVRDGIKSNAKICDLGTGNGIIPLILSHKVKTVSIWGIDIQEKAIELAKKSVELNKLEDRISFLNLDVKDIIEDADNFMNSEMDIVTCNPPYFPKGRAIVNSGDAMATARHETTAELKDFFLCAYNLLKDKGSFYMINRPSRMVDCMCIGREIGLEPRMIKMVSSKADTEPKMVLFKFIKKGGKECNFSKPLIIYDENNQYTKDMLEIYERI